MVNNLILDMVKNELELDHHYIAQKRLILVKIDAGTMENPVLKEW